MTTKKLYQSDVYQKECDSTIVDILGDGIKENPTILALDQSIFFPTGGGQPCDLGSINGIPVVDVYEKDGIVFHKLSGSAQSCGNAEAESRNSGQPFSFQIGETVHSTLDWERRFRHMQRHCGEHILSGIFFQELGGINRGFHMGDSYMTIDIDVPNVSWEDVLRIEYLTNQVIWSNVPVTTRYFTNREEAEKLPLRKALAIDEDISIVCVGSEDNPSDCVACCGTHPSTSGQVGVLKIIKLESNKGMTRVYFKSGEEAFQDYRHKHQILTELNQKYSSDDSNLMDKMRTQEEKNKAVRQELYQIKNAFLGKVTDEILKEYLTVDGKQGNSNPASGQKLAVIVREYPFFSVNDLLNLSKGLLEQLRNLIVLVSPSENTVILTCSGKEDCGKIVKDNAGVWKGKGGGNAGSARAMFPSAEDLNCFVTFIKQAY